MLIFHEARLVVFSIPRTGSTSLHGALREKADIEISDPPAKKHMTVRRFESWAEGRGEVAAYTRVAIMREPLARIASWYRYRRRDAVRGTEMSAEAYSFDAYVDLIFSDDPPPLARVGNQHRFLSRKGGGLGVDEILCLERTDVLSDFFKGYFSDFRMRHRNAAPLEPFDLTEDREARLRAERAEEFALFERVAETGRLTL